MVVPKQRSNHEPQDEYSPSDAEPRVITPDGREIHQSASWFARQGVERLYLDGNRWIEIREELTYLESEKLQNVGVESFRQVDKDNQKSQEFQLALHLYNLEKIKTWVVDWNAIDEDGYPIACTSGTVDNLRPAVGREIVAAIDRYEASLDPEKNVPRLAER